jgi:hypothetical protein
MIEVRIAALAGLMTFSVSSTLAAAVPNEIAIPPAGMGTIVFWRSGTIVGLFENCAIHEDKAKISSLPRGRYFSIVVTPGKRTYSVRGLSGNAITLEVESDEIQYVECRTVAENGGLFGQSSLATLRPSSQADFQNNTSLKPVKEQPVASATTATNAPDR